MLVGCCRVMILESPAIPTNKICAKYIHTYSLATAITTHGAAPTPQIWEFHVCILGRTQRGRAMIDVGTTVPLPPRSWATISGPC